MHYQNALKQLQGIVGEIVFESSERFYNNKFPRFYKPLLYLVDLAHYKRRKQLLPFKVIGKGMFSLIVKHPDVKGVVFKIHGDDGYDEYVNYTKDHYSPVHVKVFDSVMCGPLNTELTEENIFIKAIEELKPINLTENNKDMMRNIKLFEEGKEYSILNIPDDILEHMHVMKELTSATNTRLDIWHNIMQRKGNDFVSIDPLAYSFL